MIGSTSNYTYILFVCENAVRLIWSVSSLSPYQKIGIKIYIPPIRLISNVGSLKIITLPTIIQEGIAFGPNNSKIQVFDNRGDPLTGKLVMCLIASMNSQVFNFRYSSAKKGFLNKDVIKPFPGHYGTASLNPLSDYEDLTLAFTNEQGVVEFDETSFSVFGQIGKISDFLKEH